MKTKAAAVMLALLAMSIGAGADDRQKTAADLVAAARAALGGEAALEAVASFTVTGTLVRNIGSSPTSFLETTCVLPDKFLRVARRNTGGPIDYEITSYDGLNGDRVIRDTVAPNAPFPVTIPGRPPATQEEAAARAAKALAGARRDFAGLVLPLFVKLPGVELSAGEPVSVKSGAMDVLVVKHADGTEWQLRLDAKTHLPAEFRWMAMPVVTFSTSATTTSLSAPPPVPKMPDDPTAGLSDVQWVMTIGDYKVTDGVNWPRRLTTMYDGKRWEDIRVSKYRLNPKIDLKIFDRTR